MKRSPSIAGYERFSNSKWNFSCLFPVYCYYFFIDPNGQSDNSSLCLEHHNCERKGLIRPLFGYSGHVVAWICDVWGGMGYLEIAGFKILLWEGANNSIVY